MSIWSTLAVLTLLLAGPLAGCLSPEDQAGEPQPDRVLVWNQPAAWARFADPGNVTAPSPPGSANTFSVSYQQPRTGFQAQNKTLDALVGPGNWSLRTVRVHVGDLLQPIAPGEDPKTPTSGGWLHLSASGRLQATFWGTDAPQTALAEAGDLLGPIASSETTLDAWVDRFKASELREGEGEHARFHYAAILPHRLNVTPLVNELEPTFQPRTRWDVGVLDGVSEHADGNTTFSISLAAKQALRDAPGEHLRVVVDPLDRVRVDQESAYVDPPRTKAQAGGDLFRSLEALGVITHVLQHGEVWETASRSLWPDQPGQAPPRHR